MAVQTYNMDKLVDDVVRLLEERGLTPNREAANEAELWNGAKILLRNLGIEPTISMERSLDLDGHMRYNRRIHGD